MRNDNILGDLQDIVQCVREEVPFELEVSMHETSTVVIAHIKPVIKIAKDKDRYTINCNDTNAGHEYFIMKTKEDVVDKIKSVIKKYEPYRSKYEIHNLKKQIEEFKGVQRRQLDFLHKLSISGKLSNEDDLHKLCNEFIETLETLDK
jgi:GTP cyclohydrolase III